LPLNLKSLTTRRTVNVTQNSKTVAIRIVADE